MVVLAEDRKTMLIGFSVSNYKSFFQEQHISFVASKVARHKNHIVQHGMRKIVKAADQRNRIFEKNYFIWTRQG